jgi:hypothetical protein
MPRRRRIAGFLQKNSVIRDLEAVRDSNNFVVTSTHGNKRVGTVRCPRDTTTGRGDACVGPCDVLDGPRVPVELIAEAVPAA